MRFVKVKDEERTGDVAINLDLVREAHFGGGLLHLYFERSATTQDDVTFTGENAQNMGSHGLAQTANQIHEGGTYSARTLSWDIAGI